MKRRPAFTLVELLVVIGIVTVLIAMLLPALGKARRQALAVACASNMRQIGGGMLMYANAHKGILPYSSWKFGVTWADPCYSWDDLIDKWIGGRQTDADILLNGVFDNNSLPVLQCPADPYLDRSAVPGLYHRSYAMNAEVGGPEVYLSSSPFVPVSVPITKLRAGAQTILLVENPHVEQSRGRSENASCWFPAMQSYEYFGAPWWSTVSIPPKATRVGTHPNDTFNYLYADGHVDRKYPTDTDGYYGVDLRGILPWMIWNNYTKPRGEWSLDPGD
jgi:prepilin-type processing-associated H-X9-DG protein/prepilin-type N-terminal cleavage/methylation domain-containing protein